MSDNNKRENIMILWTGRNEIGRFLHFKYLYYIT